MELPRRQFLHLAAGAAALSAVVGLAKAESYLTRPIRLIVSYPAGSSPDIIARLVGQWLSDRLGQQFIIENRPGFGGNIATEFVLKSAPDGYTLLMAVSTNAVNATLYDNLNYNFMRDSAPVARIANAPFVVVVPATFPARTIAEFIAHAKANPGQINMASGGNGSSPHIFGELFKSMAGVDLVHVPYRGPYMTDLVAGQVQVVFAPMPQAIELIRSGKLRALAVTPATRQPMLPDLPAIAEFVPGYEAVGWYGLSAPRGTPADIVGKLSDATTAALADPQAKMRLADLGVEAMPLNSAEFGKFVAAETDKWARVIRTSGIRPE